MMRLRRWLLEEKEGLISAEKEAKRARARHSGLNSPRLLGVISFSLEQSRHARAREEKMRSPWERVEEGRRQTRGRKRRRRDQSRKRSERSQGVCRLQKGEVRNLSLYENFSQGQSGRERTEGRRAHVSDPPTLSSSAHQGPSERKQVVPGEK